MPKDLVSMQLSPSEAKEACEPCAESKRPRFPWGLSLTLDDEVLQKLKITQLPKVGSSEELRAVVKVTRISEDASEEGKHRSIGLQITDLAFGDPDDAEAAESALYGK
jgi:hypothetical protein